MSTSDKFGYQVGLIREAFTDNNVIMGAYCVILFSCNLLVNKETLKNVCMLQNWNLASG